MLCTTRELMGYQVRASDGEVGRVHDFYFDDQDWLLRYMVVDAGSWLEDHKILVAAAAFGRPDGDAREVAVVFTSEQVEQGPSADEHPPVSKQQQTVPGVRAALPGYLAAGEMPIPLVFPQLAALAATQEAAPGDSATQADPHLRSVREVCGYHLEASDGSIGHVADFVFEDSDGSIRYVVADTRNWLPGQKVLLVPGRVERIDWQGCRMHVGLSKEQVEEARQLQTLSAGGGGQ